MMQVPTQAYNISIQGFTILRMKVIYEDCTSTFILSSAMSEGGT